MNILVTGASGFVGGRFMSRFADCPGVALHGIGRRALAQANYSAIDLSRPFQVDFAPDVVIHAAAMATPWGTRAEYERHNVTATQNVVDFCLAHRRPRLVYVSSSSVFYHDGDQIGMSEETPIGPDFVNDYAATKYAGEQIVSTYPGAWVVLRPRAVFGPGDTVLFPRILTAARAGTMPVFTGPRAVGDLIYIDTLVDYLMAAAARPDVIGCYNLTNNQPIVIQDLLLDIFARLGLPAPRRRVPVRVALALASIVEAGYRLLGLSGEPPITRYGVGVFAWSKTFNVARALRYLGQPSTTLQDGVDAFVAWQREQSA
jgi:nucleoside-diphosphate-sugar epimerase